MSSVVCLVLCVCVLAFFLIPQGLGGVDRSNRSCPTSGWGNGIEGLKMFSHVEVLQVTMIRPDEKWNG